MIMCDLHFLSALKRQRIKTFLRNFSWNWSWWRILVISEKWKNGERITVHLIYFPKPFVRHCINMIITVTLQGELTKKECANTKCLRTVHCVGEPEPNIHLPSLISEFKSIRHVAYNEGGVVTGWKKSCWKTYFFQKLF